LCQFQIDGVNIVLCAELFEFIAIGSKGAGINNLCTGFLIRFVDSADDVRIVQTPYFRANTCRQAQLLELCSGSAVQNHNFLF